MEGVLLEKQCQMSKFKVQIKSKAQMSKILNFEICLPARSRFGEGRDFGFWNFR
jgi:hypothetical protein